MLENINDSYFTNFDVFEEAKRQSDPRYVYLRSAERVIY
jgi:hypothetical protein